MRRRPADMKRAGMMQVGMNRHPPHGQTTNRPISPTDRNLAERPKSRAS
jgi:hypothetical protein